MNAATAITGNPPSRTAGLTNGRPVFPGVCAAARSAMSKSSLGKTFLASQAGTKPVIGVVRRGYPTL